MKKALFVDHAFHQKTRSSDFFIDILRRGLDVEVYYLSPEGPVDLGVLDAAKAADVVILWQIDFMAPVFRAMGKPTVVIPMYDGSAGLPSLHWIFATGARFCNFSFTLNERIRSLGGKTMPLRYFPPAVDEKDLPRFDRLNAFFWQRRPDHGPTFDYVDALIGNDLDRFHLHNAPDVPGYPAPRVRKDATYEFSESTWFKSKADFEACLKASNVFIAPRASEGIGLALLEAMAAGMFVLAHDAPTNNEYVSNGHNGILFNKDVRHEPIAIRSMAQSMARLAWLTVVEGHRKWVESQPAILEWVLNAEPGKPVPIDLREFTSDLWYSYYGSIDEYERFLRRHLGLLLQLCDRPLTDILAMIGGDGTASSQVPVVTEHRLPPDGRLDITSDSDKHIGKGWSHSEREWRWAIGKRSELFFSGLDQEPSSYRACFTALAYPELGKSVNCTITLNGTKVFAGRLRPEWGQYEFAFASDLLVEDNRIELSFDKALSTESDPRELSVCFKTFQLMGDDGAKSASMWQKLSKRIQG